MSTLSDFGKCFIQEINRFSPGEFVRWKEKCPCHTFKFHWESSKGCTIGDGLVFREYVVFSIVPRTQKLLGIFDHQPVRCKIQKRECVVRLVNQRPQRSSEYFVVTTMRLSKCKGYLVKSRDYTRPMRQQFKNDGTCGHFVFFVWLQLMSSKGPLLTEGENTMFLQPVEPHSCILTHGKWVSHHVAQYGHQGWHRILTSPVPLFQDKRVLA